MAAVKSSSMTTTQRTLLDARLAHSVWWAAKDAEAQVAHWLVGELPMPSTTPPSAPAPPNWWIAAICCGLCGGMGWAADGPPPDVDRQAASCGRRSAWEIADDQREAVWELHLRGVAKARIAAQMGLHRDTVTRLINEGYRAFGAERKARLKRGLDGAVARMRRIQQQAWADHDADDERERRALEQAEYGARYTSQRSAYLRLALDAEKEIARLEGLYADDAPDVLGVLFQVIRVESGRDRRQGQVVVTAGSGDDGENDPQDG